ncbi:uncharacterized protein MELLADRAFT_89997 [Melampsora larici-populina 98AG31]|uniref:CxC5 like cysteine cluster associated with KDZ domain-containing protein n=1 Tax=Melampsora larici-populina (strain 98AG31 / pathotype 3-4-7) TaxID=747676 RepID=F4RVD4_MELLP|nr:uncharacterized protein MELLADRAFT_89997 [Melampsora larici-populina 98AG31]EGG03688.1 hypothetical protein MELLADRAFT_89997 [Melampsora larici-populina 98AG31]
MLLRDFTTLLDNQSPSLSTSLTVTDFVRFATLAGEVHHRAGKSLRLSPDRNPVLPFLQSALSMQPTANHLLADLWHLSFPFLRACRIDPGASIRKLGIQLSSPGTTNTNMHERFLRSPLSKCIVCTPDQSYVLHVHSRINGYLHDIDGVHTVQTVILNCSNPKCGTVYRPSYYNRDGERLYYTKAMGREDDYLHVLCHYYMSRRLAYMFRVLQMLAHVSHFNLVNWYNMMFVEDTPAPTFTAGQLFTPSMSEEACRHGLTLHSLMKHADRRGTQLVVSSSGVDNIRFDCVRVKSDGVDSETGQEYIKSIRAVVTDGLTIGHWRCSASSDQLREIALKLGHPMPEGPCTNKLDNINDRFCRDHFVILGNRCQAQPCSKAAITGSETCEDVDHIKAWAAFNEKIKGNFSLTSILNRPGSHLPTDPTVHLDADTAQILNLEVLQHADESQRAHEAARDGGESQAAGKYLLSRSRTHNDQLIVAPCGIILARKTFYNAESVSAVKVDRTHLRRPVGRIPVGGNGDPCGSLPPPLARRVRRVLQAIH